MGLMNALNIANSGLRTVQSGLTTVANNVAQADVEGYKRQEMRAEEIGVTGGVRAAVVRASDSFLENQLRVETSRSAQTSVNATFLSRVDQMFGVPGEAGSLDGRINGFNNALQQLSGSPDDFTSRQLVIGSAEQLADGLNVLSSQVQDLRQLAEDNIATSVDDINDSLKKLENINLGLAGAGNDSPAHAELMNERDRQLSRLSENMEIRVGERDNGTVSIFTKSGNSLLEGTAVQLDFDRRGNLNAGTQYSHDEAQRGVGTVTLHAANGYKLDLVNNGILDTGRIGALINMRDNVLVETQDQLDELAAGLASSMSNNNIAGQPATDGDRAGFDINLASLQQGNSISLSFDEGGVSKNVTLVRVDDPSLLPLSNDHTASSGDQVIGVDFSGGLAAAASSISTALGGGIDVSATATGLRFLDDGAANTTQIKTLNSEQTPASLQDRGTGLPMFMDGQGAQVLYTNSMEGVEQKTGLAGRISVNGQLRDNNELLVRYSSAPETAIGDTTRPLDLIDRFNNSRMPFSPKTGIGSGAAPYRGSIADFGRQIISDQTGKAASAAQANKSQEIVVGALGDQLANTTGVKIDEELAKLISLQNSYAANARIMSAVDEMMKQLMRI